MSTTRLSARARSLTLAAALACATLGCFGHHEARVVTAPLPPPPGPKVFHTSRLVVHVRQSTASTQCVAAPDRRPVCFENLRPSLEAALLRSLWPSFPVVVLAPLDEVTPADYLLEVDVKLDAIAPDRSGPGWSAGAQSRFRLSKAGQLLAEETLASRSRAEFPYGAPLGSGASEVVDATVLHIAQRVSLVEENAPFRTTPLPSVAAYDVRALDESASRN